MEKHNSLQKLYFDNEKSCIANNINLMPLNNKNQDVDANTMSKIFGIVATCKSITSQAINKPEMRKSVTTNLYMTSIMPTGICGRSEHHKGTNMVQN